MHAPPSRSPASPRHPVARRWRWGLAVLLLLVCGCLVLTTIGQRFGSSTLVINPCTGEVIALRDDLQFLPHLTPEQSGAREASVNAVGLSGLGSRGTYYLPLGTSKAVVSFANGSLDLAAGGDLELIGRSSQGNDFLFHSIAHLKLSLRGGLRGSGLAVQARCA